MANLVIDRENSKQKLLEGINKLCDAVKSTLGPKGRNVIIDNHTTPLITNDGVTIAKAITLEDQIENIGAKLVKEVSIKTNEIAGDGTTTACCLAQAIVQIGNKYIDAGANPLLIKRGIYLALKLICETLEKNSEPITSSDDIKKIATISCQDEEIGSLIANAFDIVGNNGVITIEENKKLNTELEITYGMRINSGYYSPYFISDTAKAVNQIPNCKILIIDKKVNDITPLLQIIEHINKNHYGLLIIANDYSDEVVNTLIYNKLRGLINNVILIKSPAYGEYRSEELKDIAIVCGASVIDNTNLDEIWDINTLGSCKSIKISKDSTTIIDGDGNQKLIEARIDEIKKKLEDNTNEKESNILSLRRAKLASGVAVIKVGAISEVELNEKKLRVEDALNATKSAILKGTSIGGGCGLVKCQKELSKLIKKLNGDVKLGASILYESIERPLRQIAKNSAVDDGVIYNKVASSRNINFGYDAYNNKFCNLRDAGIIDPTLVTITALKNAVSVASTILTTDCIVG